MESMKAAGAEGEFNADGTKAERDSAEFRDVRQAIAALFSGNLFVDNDGNFVPPASMTGPRLLE